MSFNDCLVVEGTYRPYEIGQGLDKDIRSSPTALELTLFRALSREEDIVTDAKSGDGYMCPAFVCLGVLAGFESAHAFTISR